jgi:protein involved in polysaccharide export with SLBB domain
MVFHSLSAQMSVGDRVDTASERRAPQGVSALIAGAKVAEDGNEVELKPFGSNMFRGTFFSSEREDGLNPEYIIQPGDRISVRIWGAASVNEVVVVDAQGNIFIPEVGPIKVQGIKNGQLSNQIKSSVARVFTQNINVYTNLQATTPVLVFVTGFVNRPGAYAGVASDSLLYFLERAGGIDLDRGSFREIRVSRQQETIATADLYDFLISGQIPKPQFTDGDTIIVNRRGANVAVDGAVRNRFSFEISEAGITGADLINVSRPLADASHVTLIGTREGAPFSAYLPRAELLPLTLVDGDKVVFEVDQVHETMLVRVEGSHLGQSRFAVPRDTRLLEVLDYVAVDTNLADVDSISIRRFSLKVRQKRALEDSLARLETAFLSKRSITKEGAEIQIREAELISNFVQRARDIDPEGILVVSKNGVLEDVLLQPDDVITIPERTNIVQISGEVMVPQAMVYVSGESLQGYINRVGGYTERADQDRHLVLRRNGEVIPLLEGETKLAIQPGDEIISMPEIPSRSIEVVQLVTETIFRIASAAAIFVRF